MEQSLFRAALIEVESALRRGGTLGRAMIEQSRERASAVARGLSLPHSDDLAQRSRLAHDAMASSLDDIENELRSQAGLLEGVLLEATGCVTLGGAEVAMDAPEEPAHRNEDRVGIVLDVRGRQVGWVFDGARRYSGYSCEHDINWFGDHLSEAVRELANRDEGDDLRVVLEAVLARVADEHRGLSCGAPLAEQWGTVALARLDGWHAELVVVNDCQIAVRPDGAEWSLITDDRMTNLLEETSQDQTLRRAYQDRYYGRPSTSAEESNARQAEFEAVFLPWMNRHDVPDDQTCWVLTPNDPSVAWKAVRERVTLAPGDDLVLMTSDGVDLPLANDWDQTVEIVSGGALRGLEVARAMRGPSYEPGHAMPYPDMSMLTLRPRETPRWAAGGARATSRVAPSGS